MKAAFIVMTILGCDDAGATCSSVAQVEEQWQTIAACDAASEAQLSRFKNVDHPMVVAVCQTANSTALADSKDDAALLAATRSLTPAPQPPQDGSHERGITARAVQIMVSDQLMPSVLKFHGMRASISDAGQPWVMRVRV